MTLRSSLYVGSVMHRRIQPRMHRFRYQAFWLLLDLDELDEPSSKLRWFSHNRSNIFSFYDADHGDGTQTPLRVQVEQQLSEAGVDLYGGQIRLLCMPRTLGYCFNPISIFFSTGRMARSPRWFTKCTTRSANDIAMSSGLWTRAPQCINVAKSSSTSRPFWKWTCAMISGSLAQMSVLPLESPPVHQQNLC
jgi:hypothetical protein